MAQTITPKDLGIKAFQFGSFYESEKVDMNNLVHILRDNNGDDICPKTPGDPRQTCDPKLDKDKHFVQDFYPFSFSLGEEAKTHPEDVTLCKLNLFPVKDTDDTHKIVYLPYYSNNITSITIPPGGKSVRYFMTDSMSGCNLYIDKRTNGELVCYHANALYVEAEAKKEEAKKLQGTMQDVEAKKKVDKKVQEKMDEMHRSASGNAGDDKMVKICQERYFAKVRESENQTFEGQTDRRFLGAATIMGFCADNGQWVFHFQTVGRISYYIEESEETGSFKPAKVMGKIMGKLNLGKEDLKGKGKEGDGKEVDRKGKGKEVKHKKRVLKIEPLKIFDYGPL